MIRLFIKNSKNLIVSSLKLTWRVIGFHIRHVEDAVAIRDLKKLESICISFNILPNGFSQDPSITPSRWTKVKSILYLSLMTIHIIHLTLLCFFELTDEWLLVLGDFFYDQAKRRYFWLLWLNGSILSEVLRHYWIFLAKKDQLTPFVMYHSLYANGFNSEVLLMNQFYCHKFRFVVTNLVNVWLLIVQFVTFSLAPILILLVHSGPQSPQTYAQFIYSSFWLLITYLGIVFTMNNVALTGGLCTIYLSYFYYKASYIAEIVKDLASRRGKLNNVDYLLDYKATVNEIIKYQNEIEQINIFLRNWLLLVYLGLSCATDFGGYIAVFVHIDQFMDVFMVIVASTSVFVAGACAYTNGVILTKVSRDIMQL